MSKSFRDFSSKTMSPLSESLLIVDFLSYFPIERLGFVNSVLLCYLSFFIFISCFFYYILFIAKKWALWSRDCWIWRRVAWGDQWPRVDSIRFQVFPSSPGWQLEHAVHGSTPWWVDGTVSMPCQCCRRLLRRHCWRGPVGHGWECVPWKWYYRRNPNGGPIPVSRKGPKSNAHFWGTAEIHPTRLVSPGTIAHAI